jgi:hypothetical protein
LRGPEDDGLCRDGFSVVRLHCLPIYEVRYQIACRQAARDGIANNYNTMGLHGSGSFIMASRRLLFITVAIAVRAIAKSAFRSNISAAVYAAPKIV